MDQAGRNIDFVVDDDTSDVQMEASLFCNTHMPAADAQECVDHLEHLVETHRGVRRQAQANLPGLSFTVRSPTSSFLRFVHEEGANPGDEAAAFCAEHFTEVSEEECVEEMLRNMQKAYEEATQKSERKKSEL